MSQKISDQRSWQDNPILVYARRLTQARIGSAVWFHDNDCGVALTRRFFDDQGHQNTELYLLQASTGYAIGFTLAKAQRDFQAVAEVIACAGAQPLRYCFDSILSDQLMEERLKVTEVMVEHGTKMRMTDIHTKLRWTIDPEPLLEILQSTEHAAWVSKTSDKRGSWYSANEMPVLL